MFFGDLPLDDCLGALLAHGRAIGGKRAAKGQAIDAALIAAARAAGLDRLTVARLDPGDVPETDAAVALGAALAGPGLAAQPPVHGRVNLSAASAGLFRCDPAAVTALNRLDPSMTLGTLPPFARVAAGEIVATVKIIPYAVPRGTLDAALAAAAVAKLSLAPFRPLRAALVQTRLPGQADKLFAKTASVTRARVESLGGTLIPVGETPHEPASLAAALTVAADLLLVAGASATADRDDVVPAAIDAAGGTVIRVGMPVDPGNLLVLGEIGGRPVIGLPGCARSPKRNGVDLVLERLFAGLPLDSDAIAAMGVGGLLPDLIDRPATRASARAATGPVGAIILAAGRSSRMGEVNKLLADLDGKPLVAHIAGALMAANIPALAVTGNAAKAVRAALDGRVAAFADAPDFADGLSRSLRAGVRAAPSGWRGALVCLGDMPRIAPALLRRLGAALGGEDGIVVPVRDGKRGNPVLWGRAHFARLAALDGDVGGKALLGEFADHVVEVEADDDSIFADVDTPADLAALRA